MTNSKISPTNAAILMLRAIFLPFLRNATVSSTTPRQIKPVVDSVLRMVTISSAIAQQYFFLLMPMRVSSLIRNSSAKFRKIWWLPGSLNIPALRWKTGMFSQPKVK